MRRVSASQTIGMVIPLGDLSCSNLIMLRFFFGVSLWRSKTGYVPTSSASDVAYADYLGLLFISYWLWMTDGRPIHPGINGALTRAQKQKDHSDTLESFTNDIIKSGGGRSTPELVDVLVQKSAEVSERIQASLAFVSLGLLRAPA